MKKLLHAVLKPKSQTQSQLVSDESYIVVVQYQRADFGLGDEHEFHWAIAIVDDLGNLALAQGPVYQVYDVTYTLENRTEWRLHKTAVLGKTDKWRGGVIIGKIKKADLEELDTMLSNHYPVVSSVGWNCRSWVMEAIALMAAKGWIPTEIHSQERLLPTLRVVHKASLESMARGDTAVIYNLDHGV